MKILNLIFIGFLLLTLSTGCDKNNDHPSQTLYGKAVALGKDSVRSFITFDPAGKPQAIGLQFGENALNGLPTDTMPGMPDYMYPLTLPEKANITGVDHLEVDWNPFGHEPRAIYGVPHFDFHFNGVSSAEINAIDCKDLTKPAAIPAGYGLPDFDLPPDASKMMGVKTMIGLCVPKMGMHAVPTADIERKEPITASMVVGYNIGKPIFVEPMISKATLMKKASFDLPMSAIPGQTGGQPSKFHAEYDAQKQEYRLILSGFSAGI